LVIAVEDARLAGNVQQGRRFPRPALVIVVDVAGHDDEVAVKMAIALGSLGFTKTPAISIPPPYGYKYQPRNRE
jgi:hypothetical protein